MVKLKTPVIFDVVRPIVKREIFTNNLLKGKISFILSNTLWITPGLNQSNFGLNPDYTNPIPD